MVDEPVGRRVLRRGRGIGGDDRSVAGALEQARCDGGDTGIGEQRVPLPVDGDTIRRRL
jgi:hypothetical protein